MEKFKKMSLRELRNTLSVLMCKETNAADDFVFKATYKLIPLLLELGNNEKNTMFKEKSCHILNLRYLVDNAAIRYCGRFFNQIKISREKALRDKKLTLRFVSYSIEDSMNQNYPGDKYLGTEADGNIPDAEIDSTNVYEFVRFAKGLSRFFRKSEIHDKYLTYLNDLESKLSEYERIKNDIFNEFDEDKFTVFDKIFSKYTCYDDNKRILIFPDNTSIRYRGKFHNCLIYDHYDICLGYVIHNYDFPDDQYYNDEYTKFFDSEKYESKLFTLIHEYSLSAKVGGTENVYSALNAMIQLFEDELESDKPVLQYLEATDVCYKRYINEK